MHPDTAVAPPTGSPLPPAADGHPSGPAFQLPLRPGRRAEVHGAAAAVAAGFVCAVTGALAIGRDGAAGSVVATVFVALFFATGLLPVLVAGSLRSRTSAALGLLLINYTFRLFLALVALLALQRQHLVHMQWLGLTIVCCTLAWTAGHLAAVIRASRTL